MGLNEAGSEVHLDPDRIRELAKALHTESLEVPLIAVDSHSDTITEVLPNSVAATAYTTAGDALRKALYRTGAVFGDMTTKTTITLSELTGVDESFATDLNVAGGAR
ncbi:hypothetical protein ACFXNW_18380 [Nocardia sp. NPDC059180]|uniref:hypothetical protein n=1 Tax=Nocardia sp. NPDC059180 TaxID=3346761 RepID=UPI0036958AD0